MTDPVYSAKPLAAIETKPGCWNYNKVGVFDHDAQIGEYIRDYPAFYNTFCPFKQGDHWFALYSKEYTSTRIMSLPDCVDLGGEESSAYGFCPVDYYVPALDRDDEQLKGEFGFVAGCVWGDDNSWKIQYLDLRKASEGIIVRSARFGYIPLPSEIKLFDAIKVAVDHPHKFFYIATEAIYREDDGVLTDFTDAHENCGKAFNEETGIWEERDA